MKALNKAGEVRPRDQCERPMDIASPKAVRIAGVALAGLAIGQILIGSTGGHPGSGRPLYDVAAALGGVALLAAGFVLLHKKRVIENVPPSRIRSVAMGFAEISGIARAKTPVVAPLSGMSCVFYKYLVEEERTSSRGGREWRTIDRGQSADWFYLEDPTGKIVVDPDGADVDLGRDFRNIERGEGFLARKQRCTEWRLNIGEAACVVGTVRRLRNLAQERRVTLNDSLRALKHDPERMKTFDADHDGRISTEEWGNAVRVVEDQVLKEEVARPSGPPEDDLIIAKGQEEKTFVISDKGERDLVRALSWKAGLALVGGAALTAAGAVSLLARAGLIGRGFFLSW